MGNFTVFAQIFVGSDFGKGIDMKKYKLSVGCVMP